MKKAKSLDIKGFSLFVFIGLFSYLGCRSQFRLRNEPILKIMFS